MSQLGELEEEQLQGLFGALSEAESEDDQVTLKYDTYNIEKHPISRKIDCTTELRLALLDRHHSLWAEFIYNAARLMADLMVDASSAMSSGTEARTVTVEQSLPHIKIESSDNCLELGAGAGLPGLMASLCGARRVVVSDYGSDLDLSLIYPIDANIEYICQIMPEINEIHAVAYTWGYAVYPLTNTSQYYQHRQSFSLHSYALYTQSKLSARIGKEELSGIVIQKEDKFDKIFLADLIFNRSEHRKLLWTVRECLKPLSGICYVTFSHHDPSKAALDLKFFELAKEDFGFSVRSVGEVTRPSYPFRESDGLDEKRGIVHLYTLQIL